MIDFAAIRAISFDLDDTLWAIAPVIERAEQASRDWLLTHYPDTRQFFDVYTTLELRTEVFNDFPERYFDLTFLRKECIGRILESSGYDRSGVEQAFAVFKYQRDTVKLYDDVMPFFEQLAPGMIRIALTNGNASLHRTPLNDHFHTYLNAIAVSAPKPEAPMFLEALSRHDLEPHQLLHIGDDLVADIGGARGLGIPTVWVNRQSRYWNDGHSRPHIVVNSLAQLLHLLE